MEKGELSLEDFGYLSHEQPVCFARATASGVIPVFDLDFILCATETTLNY
ncbi:hypothetical protein J2Y86_005885 [Pseudomonas migulae]|nr:hypothetical protein [Pseudomonas migulae]MCP1501178.1 hypothetical protein [Pseudomonas migulae]